MMKFKLKILKESRYQGLYSVTGIQPGSIDMFIKHFVDIHIDVQMSRREFFTSTFGDEIESLTDEDIPRTSARGYGSALDKVKVALRSGTSHWYNQVFGSEIADFVIEAKVLMYLTELAEGLERIGYDSITSEEFNRLPQNDKNLVFEKHFLEDYLDSFINDHVKMDSMNTTGFLDNPGVGAGLYGQMKDWYMSTAGADVLGQKIKELLPMLPQRAA